MTASEVRNWLGLYVLCLTVFLGGYCFLAPDWILPLESSDRTASFEIIVPFLIAQVAAVYRFFTDPDSRRRTSFQRVPAWVVKAPPIFVTLLLICELSLFGFAGTKRETPPSAESFKGLLTFCVALLNASTMLVITKYFESKSHTSQDNEGQIEAVARSKET